MMELLQVTLRLYRHAFRATVRSCVRSWIIAVAVVIFAALMVVATSLARSLGMVGGFIIGGGNALLVGAMLSLVSDAVLGARTLRVRDIWESFGDHFWDVISVGFVLWVPVMVLERGMAANPNGPFIIAAVFFLLFILLNPAPEVIYQVRHGSPLEVIKESYEFVLENWLEWFLPLAVLVAPLGLSFFYSMTGRIGRGAGLHFFEILVLPFTVVSAWLQYLGVPGTASSIFVLVLTPPLAVAMMIFRGHLFAALHGSSRRQRIFQGKFAD
ncbi:MAG: hypothetical protein VST64_08230 [Nitrospirota bacterium]|nr:hypothetical protein [Nitrospirota bacterium]